MADNIKLVQSQEFRLAIGANTGATSIRVSNLKDVDGNALAMTDFGTKGFGTLEPNTSREEAIVFTGITDNSDTTYTLTGVSNVITKAPYTESSGTTKTHTGGAVFIISDNPGLLTTFANKDNDETINQTWTYSVPNYPKIDTPGTPPTDDAQFIPKKYADDNKIDKDGTLAMAADLNMGTNKIVSVVDPTSNQDAATKKYADDLAIAGAPNASETVKGIVEKATDAEVIAGTETGSTGALLFLTPTQLQALGSNNVQTFTSSGTWSKPTAPAGSNVLIEIWGAGGSGASGSGVGNEIIVAQGGAGGGYASFNVSIDSLSASETVTIGSGGAAVTTSTSSGNNMIVGNAGGSSTFGSYFTANGGGTAVVSLGTSLAANSTGGTGNTIINETGANGGGSAGAVGVAGSNSTFAGAGGAGQLVDHDGSPAPTSVAGGTASLSGGNGGASDGDTTDATGTAGSVPGGGGGSAVANKSSGTANAVSGAGGSGKVVVTVFR